MKFKKVVLAVLSGLVLSTGANAAVNGGTVHFVGEVVNAACAVDAGSVDQIVKMGQVRTAKLAKEGDLSTAIGFNIELKECDTTVAKTASVAFLGTAVDKYEDVLALQSSAAGGATNVGVQILDSKGIALKLDGATFSTPITLNDGTNKLPFQAQYYATGQSTAGTANADATFSIEYL